jgi:hypothetical protein
VCVPLLRQLLTDRKGIPGMSDEELRRLQRVMMVDCAQYLKDIWAHDEAMKADPNVGMRVTWVGGRVVCGCGRVGES